MINVEDANIYISENVIDIEDWEDADEKKKNRILNAAEETLKRRFPRYEIPDEAVYYFSALLAIVYNDTNRLQQQGVASFSVTGVHSFTFKKNNITTPGSAPLSSFIPDEVYEMIGEANGIKLSKRKIGRSLR